MHNSKPVFQLATEFLNITEVLPHSGFLTRYIRSFCQSSTYQEICTTFFFALLGFDSDQLNRTEFSIFLETFPAGTSLKEYKHFLQVVKSGQVKPA
ncbi:hypothetical protein NQ318_014479 [Aromia moschata]|uniref:Uncharacterized protein n=1 Tax=Aromia moschata TaxID=1265417 RepID=A0AAV8YNW5_9CUCU|nr:hypothetical protein NQ318_014479 [Aromia moschata]